MLRAGGELDDAAGHCIVQLGQKIGLAFIFNAGLLDQHILFFAMCDICHQTVDYLFAVTVDHTLSNIQHPDNAAIRTTDRVLDRIGLILVDTALNIIIDTPVLSGINRSHRLSADGFNHLRFAFIAIELTQSLADPLDTVALVQMADGHAARQLGHHELNLLVLFLQKLL